MPVEWFRALEQPSFWPGEQPLLSDPDYLRRFGFIVEKDDGTDLPVGFAIDEDYVSAYLNLGVLYLDAPSFPKMTDEQRLTTAQSYLREFKQRGVQARAEDGSPIAVDAYLDAARKQLEALGQSKRVEEKRKRGAAGGS